MENESVLRIIRFSGRIHSFLFYTFTQIQDSSQTLYSPGQASITWFPGSFRAPLFARQGYQGTNQTSPWIKLFDSYHNCNTKLLTLNLWFLLFTGHSKAALDPSVEVNIEGLILTSPAIHVQPSHPIIKVSNISTSCNLRTPGILSSYVWH
jgi:hypothetical protein